MLRDALIPLVVLLVTSLPCGLIWLQLRTRERHRRNLETTIELKEAELRTAERINSRTQRMESLGRLVGGVAHDFNNLLHVIMGNLELLATRQIDEKAQSYANSALAATKRGAHLTDPGAEQLHERCLRRRVRN